METSDTFGNQMDILAEKMSSLPEKLDRASGCLERGRLRNMLSNLEHCYNRVVDDEEEAREAYSFGRELGYTLLEPKLGERISRLKEPIDVRVIIGKGTVTALALSQLARKSDTSTRVVVYNLRQQGFIVLTWEQYQKLFNEIVKLAPLYLVGIPVEDTDTSE
jgi:hypothetical protein